MTLQLRPINLADPVQLALAHAYREDEGAYGDLPEQYCYNRERYATFLTDRVAMNPANVCFVLEHGAVVGFFEVGTGSATMQLSAGTGFVNFIYVCPALRRKGTGRQVMALAEGVLQRQGFVKARLRSVKSVAVNTVFYEKLGWQNIGPEPDREFCLVWEKVIAAEQARSVG